MSAPRSYKPHFRRFLEAAPERLHFAAHSHHLWPDASFDGQMAAWNDAARWADQKWDHVFGSLVPAAQVHIAHVLGLPDPRTIAFSPNTHELVVRLLSALPTRPRIVTTDGEFHSFARQVARLEESGDALVTRLAARPAHTLAERLAAELAKGDVDLVYLSHVFFESGDVVPSLEAVAAAVKRADTVVVVDGYHAFMALPVSLAAVADRVFYLAGGYKYAMAGEGACFLHAPPGLAPRPRVTGWFAAFGALEKAPSGVDYGPGGARFLGATFDPTALYRFVAVMDWLAREGIDVSVIDTHVRRLQERFLRGLAAADAPLRADALVVPFHDGPRAHFLAFESDAAPAWHAALLAQGVVTDVRGKRLRIGFGLYQDDSDVDELLVRMKRGLGGP